MAHVAATAPTELKSVKQAAYERFREALFNGSLRPGQFVSQRELVALLGLSVGALRELLPRLHYEGLLNVMPQRGIQITIIDLPMIRDAFQLRMALEREAVLAAIEAMPDSVLAAERERHTNVLAELASAPSAELLTQGQEIDTQFHDLLVKATDNDFLIQSYNVNSIRIRMIRLDRISLTETTLPSAFGDHLAVIDAITRRDRHGAIAAIDAHILNARARATALTP